MAPAFDPADWPDTAHPPTIAATEVHVWRVTLTARGNAELLSADERARAAKFRFPVDADRFIAARAALRTLLGKYLDESPASLVFNYGPFGKPALAPISTRGLDLRFNVSHSDDLALVSIARDFETGIDLEYVNAARPPVAADLAGVLPQSDIAMVASLPVTDRPRALLSLWTAHEAAQKLTGRGIAEAPVNQPAFTQPLAAHADYVAVLACAAAPYVVRCFTFASTCNSPRIA